MMNTLRADSIGPMAASFTFDSIEEWTEEYEKNLPVEEYTIHLEDEDKAGDEELFDACNIEQSNINLWFEEVDELGREERAGLFCLLEDQGYDLTGALKELANNGAEVYQGTLLEYADDLLDDGGLLQSIPVDLRDYFDLEAYARDLDVTEFTFAGQDWVYYGQ